MFRHLLTLISTIVLAVSAFAAGEITDTGSGYAVNACQINGNQIGKNRAFSIHNSTRNAVIKETSHPETTGENQCVNWTISPRDAAPGDSIIIEVATSSGSTMRASFTVPSGGSTSPGKETCNNECLGKMYDRAAGPARQVVNIIKENNFPVALAMQSFQDGFYREFQSVYCRSRSLDGYPGFEDGRQRGLSEGAGSGEAAGLSAASQRASNYASQLVAEQFRASVPNDGSMGRLPNEDFQAPSSMPFEPGSSPAQVEVDLNRRIQNEFSSFENYIKSRNGTNYGWDLLVTDNVRSWFYNPCNAQFTVVEPWSGSWAFQLWAEGRLTNASEINYYSGLRDKYSNGSEAADKFRSEWISEYNRDFTIKYRDYMSSIDRAAYDEGLRFAQDLLFAQAREEGYVFGYNESWAQSARTAFSSAIEQALSAAYSDAFDALASRGSVEQVDITAEVQGLGFNVVVTQATNIGGAEAALSVSVVNKSRNTIVAEGSGEALIPALSKLTEPVVAQTNAKFLVDVDPQGGFNSGEIELRKSYPVVVRAAGMNKEMQLSLEVVNVLEEIESGSQKADAVKILKNAFLADWEARGDGRFTNNNNSDSIVEEALQVSDSFGPDVQNALRQAASTVEKELPKCSGLFSICFGPTKKSKAALQRLLDRF